MIFVSKEAMHKLLGRSSVLWGKLQLYSFHMHSIPVQEDPVVSLKICSHVCNLQTDVCTLCSIGLINWAIVCIQHLTKNRFRLSVF